MAQREFRIGISAIQLPHEAFVVSDAQKWNSVSRSGRRFSASGKRPNVLACSVVVVDLD